MSQTAQVIKFERSPVKADLKKGYTQVAHDIFDTIISNQSKLTAVEIRVVLAFARKTYSFHKKSDWVTNTQIMAMTDLSKGHASNIIKSLLLKNVLFKDGKKTGINSAVSEWGVHKTVCKSSQPSELEVHNLVNRSSQPSVPEFTTSCTEVHNLVNKSSQPSEPHKKETLTKEITTKEIIYSTLPKNGIFSLTQSTKIPSHFPVDENMKVWALDEKITADLEFETAQFVDHFTSKGETREDWHPAWRFWMRNTLKFIPKQAPVPPGTSGQKLSPIGQSMAAKLANMGEQS
jgi:phage replication O-like protein O